MFRSPGPSPGKLPGVAVTARAASVKEHAPATGELILLHYSLEVSMKYVIGLLAVFVGITTVSLSLGDVIRRPQVVASDDLMSDHDKIEKLRLEVAELQDKLTALTQKYKTHTHRLRLGITRFPRLIDCDGIARAAGPDGSIGHIDQVCRQTGNDYVSVTIAGSMETMVTAPPSP